MANESEEADTPESEYSVSDNLKRCGKCGVVRPLAEFSLVKKTGRPSSYCRPCHNKRKNDWHAKNTTPSQWRKHHLRNTYGITLEQYDAMFQAQGGVCAICKQPETLVGGRHGKSPMSLAVDHDHKTGKVRALLCHDCNNAIGSLKHDPSLVLAALQYLYDHPAESPWMLGSNKQTSKDAG